MKRGIFIELTKKFKFAISIFMTITADKYDDNVNINIDVT